jgi:trans-2,3-dihydro-3-hydroxyanthranilate isomerase
VLSYDVVDVFTDRPFAGNPLAVVHGAGDLETEQLAALAREFNLSETTFPGPPEDAAYPVRIFTPGGEIPFAGHPTLGTAWVLRQHDRLPAGTVVQRCGAGDIEVAVPEEPDGQVRLLATPRDLSDPLDAERLAAAVGLDAESVVGQARAAGCGLNWLHLPVAAEALARCRPQPQLLSALEHGHGADVRDPVAGVYVHAVDREGESVRVRARAFGADIGIVEDPATGSAAAGLGMVLVAGGVLPDGGDYTVRQGVEMGRPSTLEGRVVADGGTPRGCEVGGRVVSVASGTVAVPG